MNRHPGGSESTGRLLAMADLPAGSHVLDLGAGDGETLLWLRAKGFAAEGIDLCPRDPAVRQGNFLELPFAEGAFDACISQCAFFVSGDVPRALAEAYRVLKPGGKLLLGDVSYEDLASQARDAGFTVEREEDITPVWKEYYLEALWSEECLCGFEAPAEARKAGKKPHYTLLVGKKCQCVRGSDGSEEGREEGA